MLNVEEQADTTKDHDMKGDSTLEMQIETITPERAQHILQGNTNNRKVRPSWVKELARRIQDNEWELSHQGILLGEGEKLLDGQHRLLAIQQANVPVTLPVFHTSGTSVFKVLDQGQKRNITDLTGIANTVAAPIKFLINATPTGHSKQQSVFVIEQVASSELGNHLREISELPQARTYGSSPVRAAAAISMLRHPEDKEYIYNTYAAMVRLDFENMPKVGYSFVRQVESGVVRKSGGTVAQRENFLRACVLFDPAEKDRKSIKVAHEFKTGIFAFVEQYMTPLLKD